MIKKLSRHGNSHAIIIDKPILELLNIDETTGLKISTDGNRIVIEPMKAESLENIDDSKLRQAYEKVSKKYGRALKKLAEN